MIDHASYFDVLNRHREEETPITVQTSSGTKLGSCTVIDVSRTSDKISDATTVSINFKVDKDKQKLFESLEQFAFSTNATIDGNTKKT